ncbi:hypothetical protein BC941DRAFT_500200 [Chlamydoabsidia padenii]|nr:hypothetical protein BC941DRAFT_500200 [Chlamydoabsidia padenii]
MPVPIDHNCIRRMSTITVPKQDIHFDVYDFQQCNPQTNIDTTLESRRLEADYCKDFSCCGLVLNDLHDLLQHYEECHVQCEEDEQDSNSDNNPDDDYWSSATPPLSPTTNHGPGDSTNAASYLSDMYNHGGQWSIDSLATTGMSSFDTDSMPPTPSHEYCPDDEEVGEKISGKKRTFQQVSSTNAMDLLTLSAAKKLAMTTGDSLNALTDEEFLAHAGVLLASANTSYLYADKPYKCAVQGCDKAYKNPNGLKYHKEHGHCSLVEDNETPKPYQCTIGECGKRYKNLNGLKYHIEHSHMAALNHTLATFGCSLLQTPPPSASSSPLLDSSEIFF